MNKVACFIIDSPLYDVNETITEFKTNSDAVKYIYVLSATNKKFEGAETLPLSSFNSTENLKAIMWKIYTSHVIFYTKQTPIKLNPYSIDRFLSVAEDINAGFVYSDSYQEVNGKIGRVDRLYFQKGSIRSNFDFGSLMFFSTEAFKDAVDRMFANFEYVGLYDLILKISQKNLIIRLPEYLYTEVNPSLAIDPLCDESNRVVRAEVESACLFHLKAIGAWIKPKAEEIEFDSSKFPVEASMVVYSHNSEKTIEDAVKSALSQKANFSFNVIVVDNNSSDKTPEILQKLSDADDRLIYIKIEDSNWEIGGCYNKGIAHPKCGQFTVKLDCTDVCIDNNVLSAIINTFYEQKCAMLVGSYKTVDFNLKDIPPGVVDSKHLTPENIRSVLLEPDIGKPRAFFTPIIRDIKFPNTSYLEGYSVALAISRKYRIGRMYTPLYLSRQRERIEEDIDKHNYYVDSIRSIEIEARYYRK